MASTQICTAVSKPKVSSVADSRCRSSSARPPSHPLAGEAVGPPRCPRRRWRSGGDPDSARVAFTVSVAVHLVGWCATSDHRAAPRQRAPHPLHAQRHPTLSSTPSSRPRTDQLVAVDPVSLASDGPHDGVEPRESPPPVSMATRIDAPHLRRTGARTMTLPITSAAMSVVVAIDAGTPVCVLRAARGRTAAGSPTARSPSTPQPGGSSTTPPRSWPRSGPPWPTWPAGHRTVAAIGTRISGDVVAWDRSHGAPLHRAIVWQDRRTASRSTRCARPATSRRRATTGSCSTLLQRPKAGWLLTEALAPSPDSPVRHRRRVGAVEPHRGARRRRVRHRAVERQPHAPVRHPHPRLV